LFNPVWIAIAYALPIKMFCRLFLGYWALKYSRASPFVVKAILPRPSFWASWRYFMVFGFTLAIFDAAVSRATGSWLAITRPKRLGWTPETMLASIMWRWKPMALFMATMASSITGWYLYFLG